jgi:hypothetical protein
MQTPAIRRPTIGRTSGLPTMYCGPATAAPQLEQNRALSGNEIPQRLQKNAMIDPSSRSPVTFNIRRRVPAGSMEMVPLGRRGGPIASARRTRVSRKMTHEVESRRMIFTVQVCAMVPLRAELRFSIRRLLSKPRPSRDPTSLE